MSSKKAKRKLNKKLKTNEQTSSVSSNTLLDSNPDIQSTKELDSHRGLVRKSFERFFTKSFLLNQGSIIFKSLIKTSTYYLLTLAAQLFVFGGGLGLVWVLSHLEPKGDPEQAKFQSLFSVFHIVIVIALSLTPLSRRWKV